VQRSGNLSFNLSIKINFDAEIKNSKRFFLAGDITFQAGKNSSQVQGFVQGDSVYQGIQNWGRYCLLSEDHKNDSYIMKFSIQCVYITISDEEDCELIMYCIFV